jgi:hypothetical protein
MDKPLKNIFLNYFFILMMLLIAVFIGCDKEVSRSPVESEAPKGFIYVDSDPQGFTIFFNDRNTGRITPDSISYIDADQYEITLKKKYFKDTSVVVLLDENEKKNVFIDIISNPSMYGNLVLTTTPVGASITINDSLISQLTPFTIQDLWPGRYNIKFSLYNHRSVSFSAIVESAKSNNYTEVLRDTSVWVDYQVFNSGIPSNSLSAITFDQNNVKWIGSMDKGLIRYDEVNFINYNTSNSPIPSNKINCISIDPMNRVWVGTDFGIGIFDGISWTVYNRQNSDLTSEIINTIAFEENGTAWIGTTANLVKFDGIGWSLYYQQSEWANWFKALYIETPNDIWLGVVMNGIYKFHDNEFVRYLLHPNNNYPSNTISAIDADPSNNIWFCFLPDTAGRGGISYYDGSAFHTYFPGSTQINVNDVYADYANNKWFATSEGFLMYDAQNISTAFRTYNSLISSNLTIACTRDLSGNVWVTTFASGLNKYKPPQ